MYEMEQCVVKHDREILPLIAGADHEKRRIGQLLSRAGLRSAGVRQRRDTSLRVPTNAAGFFCAAVVCFFEGPRFDERPGVEVHWFGEDPPPFEAMSDCLRAYGYETSHSLSDSPNSGRPSMTVWASASRGVVQ